MGGLYFSGRLVKTGLFLYRARKTFLVNWGDCQDIKVKAKELSAELARIEEEAAEKKAASAGIRD